MLLRLLVEINSIIDSKVYNITINIITVYSTLSYLKFLQFCYVYFI